MKKSLGMMIVAALAAGAAFGQGTLTVNNGAAIDGSFGLQVGYTDNASNAYVQTQHPVAEGTYTVRFKIDPANSGVQNNPNANFMRFMRWSQDVAGGVRVVFFLTRSGGSSNYRILAWVRNDANVFQNGGGIFLTSGATPTPAEVEVVWTKASAPGANDGSITLTNLSSPGTTITTNGLDNDTHAIDSADIGVFTNGNPFNFSGSYDFDTFSSFR